MSIAPECTWCHGTGWRSFTRDDGVAGVVRCDCGQRSRAARLFAEARIPERYAHCELSDFVLRPPHTTPSLELAKLAAERLVEEYPMSPPLGLLFMGRPGVGKTHLAVGILKRLMREKAVRGLFRAFPELLKEIQNSYNPISRASELSLLAPVLDAEVLVMDELGAQSPTSWVQDTVGYILNHRYNENRVTILTTNYADEGDRGDARRGVSDCLVDRIGERMRSRLHEMCKTVRMVGHDFRLHMRDVNDEFRLSAHKEYERPM